MRGDHVGSPTPTRVIVNPSAGAGRAGERASRLRPRLEAAIGPLEWCESRGPEHVTELARESARAGHARVVVAGGDGTFHFAARGLAESRTAMAMLPVGTGNDIAVSVGVPRDPLAAIDLIAAGFVRRIDLGAVLDADGRRRAVYCCVLGLGMDTAALLRINTARLLRRGKLLYTSAALATLFTYRPERVAISCGGQRWEGDLFFAAVTNTPSYAGGMKITPGAEVDDGQLDLCVIPGMGLPRLLLAFPRVLGGRHENGKSGIVLARGPRLRLESARPMPITLDGELTDLRTPVQVVALPGALRVIGAPVPAPVVARELAGATA